MQSCTPNMLEEWFSTETLIISLSETSALAAEASTYEETLNRFFDWCNTTATEEECPLKNQNLPLIFDDLVASADKSPIPASG